MRCFSRAHSNYTHTHTGNKEIEPRPAPPGSAINFHLWLLAPECSGKPEMWNALVSVCRCQDHFSSLGNALASIVLAVEEWVAQHCPRMLVSDIDVWSKLGWLAMQIIANPLIRYKSVILIHRTNFKVFVLGFNWCLKFLFFESKTVFCDFKQNFLDKLVCLRK